jgi:hypothetical protein
MSDWFAGLGGSQLASALMWAVAALILLTIILVAIRLVRNMNAGTFVAGGRNRKTRLAVMDATAVDSHRRLVLVRRDDVEHLLLIGGPTDVVVEQDIRGTPVRRTQSVFGDDTDFDAQALPPLPITPQAAAQRPRATEPTQSASARPIQQQPARQPERAPPPPARPQPDRNGQIARPPRPTNARPPAPAYEPPPAYAPPPTPRTPPARLPQASLPAAPARTSTGYAPPSSNNLDDALMHELEVTFEAPPPKSTPKPVEMTLDDEMTKLLGELSNNNR